jgi:hypothetical protein
VTCGILFATSTPPMAPNIQAEDQTPGIQADTPYYIQSCNRHTIIPPLNNTIYLCLALQWDSQSFWIALLPASDNLLIWPSPLAPTRQPACHFMSASTMACFPLDPIHMGSGTASGTPLESLVVRHIPFTDVTSCKLPDPLGHHLCNSILCLSFTC